MRVALVVPGGVDRSGRERVIPALLWLIERLALRHELHVFALSQEKTPCDYELLGASIHNLGMPARSAWPGQGVLAAGTRLLSGLKRHGPFDVVHAFWANNPGFLSALAARWLDLPFVLSLGGGELAAVPGIEYGSQLRARERFKVRWTMRRADAVTVASGPMQALARGHGIEPRIVPLGVDGASFAEPSSGSGRASRLLHVASLNRVKDQPMLLRAMRRVADARPDVTLDVVGEDTLGGVVQAECESLGLAPRVTFHGFLPTDETREYFRRADLFVLSSRHEAGPVAVLEAAACGVPTVGTDVGHLRDFSPESALAVPVGDSDALAAGILALLEDDPRRRTMGEKARAWAREHDADATASAFETIYGEIVTGGSRARAASRGPRDPRARP